MGEARDALMKTQQKLQEVFGTFVNVTEIASPIVHPLRRGITEFTHLPEEIVSKPETEKVRLQFGRTFRTNGSKPLKLRFWRRFASIFIMMLFNQ